MTKPPLFLLLIAGTLAVASCKHIDKSGVFVPKDAAFVVHIHSASLSSKLSWEEIRQNEWLNRENKNTDSLARALMENPESSGINTKGDITFFVKKQNQGGYTAIEGSVKDAAAFETFNKKISKTTAAVNTKEGLQTLVLNNKVVALWDNSRFIYIMDAPQISMAGAYLRKDSTGTQPYSFSTDSLRQFGADVLAISGSDNLGSDDRFANLLRENGDVHFWMNGEQYYNDMAGGMLSLMKVDVLFHDNATAATLNFDNGAIHFRANQYMGKELRELWNKYSSKSVSDAVLNRIPGNHIAGAIAFTFSPEGFKELLKLIGVDGVINGFLGKNGFTLDDLVKAIKGDGVLAVTDFQVKAADTQAQAPGMHKEGSANVLFATSVKDRPSFDKLIGAVKSQMPEELSPMTSKVTYQINNEWFAAGNSADQIGKFLAGGANNSLLSSKIGGHPFGIYVDLHELLSSSRPFMENDSLSQASVDASLNMWQDVVITGGEKKGETVVSQATINLVDKTTNSLKQLNQYFRALGRINQQRESKYRQAF